MSNTKSKIYEKIVTILDKFANRLTRIANQTKDNSDAIVRITTEQQTLQDSISRVEFENNKREEAQVLRDQSKAFDNVAGDMKNALQTLQRLNERIGKAESQNLSLASTVSLLQNRLDSSAPPAASLPSDHVWVNKKLSGVYAVADEFEARIQKLEAGLPVVSVAELNNIVNRNRARVISAEGLCTDSLCKQILPVNHYFGPGCRFYETGY